jgi:hypothetical protein
MWPPSSLLKLLARTTVASAFQRLIERIRCSSPGSPGIRSSSLLRIVLT